MNIFLHPLLYLVASRCSSPQESYPILTAPKRIFHLAVSGKVSNQVRKISPSSSRWCRIFQGPTIRLEGLICARDGTVFFFKFHHVKSKYVHFMVESWPPRCIGILGIQKNKHNNIPECEVVTPRTSWRPGYVEAHSQPLVR